MHRPVRLTRWHVHYVQHPRHVDSGRSLSEVEELTPVRSSTGASCSSTTAPPNGSTYVNYQDDDECIDDAFETGAGAGGGGIADAATQNSRHDSSSTGYASTRGAYTRCIALYDFQVRTQRWSAGSVYCRCCRCCCYHADGHGRCG